MSVLSRSARLEVALNADRFVCFQEFCELKVAGEEALYLSEFEVALYHCRVKKCSMYIDQVAEYLGFDVARFIRDPVVMKVRNAQGGGHTMSYSEVGDLVFVLSMTVTKFRGLLLRLRALEDLIQNYNEHFKPLFLAREAERHSQIIENQTLITEEVGDNSVPAGRIGPNRAEELVVVQESAGSYRVIRGQRSYCAARIGFRRVLARIPSPNPRELWNAFKTLHGDAIVMDAGALFRLQAGTSEEEFLVLLNQVDNTKKAIFAAATSCYIYVQERKEEINKFIV